MDNYYVYEWARLDTNEVFYVGKGKGNRWSDVRKRSAYFKKVYASTACAVRKIAENLPEAKAFSMEIATISFLKSRGQASCNFTDGGEGSSGFNHSDETKSKISLLKRGLPSLKKDIPTGKPAHNRGKIMSEESRKNNATAQTGKTLSAEHKAAISAGGKGKNTGPKAEEHKAKLRLANIGKKASEETRQKMSAARKGKSVNKGTVMSEATKQKIGLGNAGKKRSDETKQRMSAAQKDRRAAQPMKTHCTHGHEFTEANTYVYKTGLRNCRICLREASRKQREKATLPIIKYVDMT